MDGERDERGGGPRGAKNVLGLPLAECGRNPLTGFFRDGCCNTGPSDRGMHTVCAIVTADFLEFSKAAGNEKPPKSCSPPRTPTRSTCARSTTSRNTRSIGFSARGRFGAWP